MSPTGPVDPVAPVPLASPPPVSPTCVEKNLAKMLSVQVIYGELMIFVNVGKPVLPNSMTYPDDPFTGPPPSTPPEGSCALFQLFTSSITQATFAPVLDETEFILNEYPALPEHIH